MDGPALGMNLTPLKLTNGNASFYWETYTALGLSLNLELIILSKLTDQQISWSSLPLPSRLWGWGVKAPCRQRVLFLLHCFTPPMPSMLPESKGYSTNISGWLPLQVCLKTCWGIAHGAMVMTRAQIPWLLWGAQGMNHGCDITEYMEKTIWRVSIPQSVGSAQINSRQHCFPGSR